MAPHAPGYSGRILAPTGDPVGTCFQVKPNVLVTAWHVLDDMGAGEPEAIVSVDALRGGMPARDARVVRVDPLHDLAVLIAADPLPRTIAGIFASDVVDRLTDVVVTGVSDVDDPTHGWAHLDAPGQWQGGATRTDGVTLGRISASAVMKGMSGAPVCRLSDDMVVGVVSGRYNSADGWLRDSVWVARSERLEQLLDGVADVDIDGRLPLGDAVDVTLRVSDTQVRLFSPAGEVTAEHAGIRPGLSAAIHDLARARARIGEGRAGQPGVVRRVGGLLAESFVPQAIATPLRDLLGRAETEHAPVRIGVEAADAALPWETLVLPGTATPLALHPLVALYRKASTKAVRLLPGPLRIVVAIAAPDSGDGPVLDYERELRNVVAAVRGARRGRAQVTVVPFASTTAIRAALAEGGVHILHLAVHGTSGFLDLEDADGEVHRIDADTFIDEAVPAGHMPPVIALSTRHTAGSDPASFAARLMQRGATAVIGTETSITDRYATWLFARVYTELAESHRPDIVRAVADARRLVHRDLTGAANKIDRDIAGLDEWGAITVQTATPELHVYDPDAPPTPTSSASAEPVPGLLSRPVGEFVGRRREQRRLPNALTSGSTGAGIVLHGIGGIGKTTLAAELTRLVPEREPGRLVVALTGALTVDGILTAVADRLRRHLLLNGEHASHAMRAVSTAGRLDVAWKDRFALLREEVLDRIPLLLVLDNAEDNLVENEFADPTVAGLLAAWACDPGLSRLLVTSRYPFTLPDDAHEHLGFHHLGPMTFAETLKLLWALPRLDDLDEDQVQRVWRMVGGHPRSLEYLDALLAGGTGRFPDISRRLAAAADNALGEGWLAQDRDLDTALAETVTLAADDVLLDALLEGLASVEGAVELLLDASVYREPVEREALPCDDEVVRALADSSLLSVSGSTGKVFVHRWTATVLHQRFARQDLDQAHMRAAQYWRSRSEHRVQDKQAAVHDLLEARHHLREAGEIAEAMGATEAICDQLHIRGAWDHEAALVHDTLTNLPGTQRQQAIWTHRLGAIAHRRGDLREAVSKYLASLAISAELDGRNAPAGSILQLGRVAHDRGDLDEAERWCRDYLAIVEERGDPAGIANGNYQLGIIAHNRGDYDEAELGDRVYEAASIHQLGMLAQHRRDLDEAERQYRAALAISREHGNQPNIAAGIHQLGVIAQLRGDLDEAEQRYQATLTIAEQVGDQIGIAISLSRLGNLAADRGHLTSALVLHVKAFVVRAALGAWPAVELRFLRGLLDELGKEVFRAEALTVELVNDEFVNSMITFIEQHRS